MTRDYLILNFLKRYEQYGVTKEFIECLVDKAESKMSYDMIHLCIRYMFCRTFNTGDRFSINEISSITLKSTDDVIKETGISHKTIEVIGLDNIFITVKDGNWLQEKLTKLSNKTAAILYSIEKKKYNC